MSDRLSRFAGSAKRAALASAAGACLGAAFLWDGGGWLCWFAFIPLFRAIEDRSPLEAFLWGGLMGAVAWGTALHWLVGYLQDMLAGARLQRDVLFVAFCSVNGLLFALTAFTMRAAGPAAARRLGGRRDLAFILTAAMSYTAFEGFCPMALPYRLAIMQRFHLPTLQILEVTGTAGVAGLIIAFNAALYLALRSAFEEKNIKWKPLAAVLVLLLLNEGYGRLRLHQVARDVEERQGRGESMTVGLVQGAVYTHANRFLAELFRKNLEIQNELSLRAVEQGAELIVWPEASYTDHRDLSYEEENGRWVRPTVWDMPLREVLQHDIKGRADFLLNAYARVGEDRIYNIAFLTGPDREYLGEVRKIHLAPFGEFLPFAQRFPVIYRFFTNEVWLRAGRTQELLTSGGGVKLGVAICYEDMVAEFNRKYAKMGAEVLVNMSNGYIFGPPALEQHLNYSALRTLETRRYLIRAVNSGISAVIDPAGRVVRRLDAGERGVIVEKIARMDGRTPYVYVGRNLYRLAAVSVMVFLVLSWRDRRSSRRVDRV